MIYCLIFILNPKIRDFHTVLTVHFELQTHIDTQKCNKTALGRVQNKKNVYHYFSQFQVQYLRINLIQMVVPLVKYILSCIYVLLLVTCHLFEYIHKCLSIKTSATCKHTSLHRLNHYKKVDGIRPCFCNNVMAILSL